MTTPGPGIANDDQLLQFEKQTAGKNPVQVPFRPVTNVNILYFNLKDGPTTDVRVRKAIALLADRKQMCIAGWGAERWGNYDGAFMSPPYGLPTADISKTTGWDQPLDARVAQAQKLMTDAGYANGFKLALRQPKWLAEQSRRNLWWSDQMRRYLKIECDTTAYDAVEIYRYRDTTDYGIIGQDSLGFLGDPDELVGYFKSDMKSNFCGYKNSTVDTLWVQQSQEMDLSKRIKACQDIERHLLTDWPAVPTAFTAFVDVWWPYVKGFVVQDASYTSNVAMERVWLDK